MSGAHMGIGIVGVPEMVACGREGECAEEIGET